MSTRNSRTPTLAETLSLPAVAHHESPQARSDRPHVWEPGLRDEKFIQARVAETDVPESKKMCHSSFVICVRKSHYHARIQNSTDRWTVKVRYWNVTSFYDYDVICDALVYCHNISFSFRRRPGRRLESLSARVKDRSASSRFSIPRVLLTQGTARYLSFAH